MSQFTFGSQGINGQGVTTIINGREIGFTSQSLVGRGATQLNFIENTRGNRIGLQFRGGLQSFAAGAAQRGGIIGALTAPFGTAINASINGDPILDPNGTFGFDNNFLTNVGLNVGNGLISGGVGAVAGGAVVALAGIAGAPAIALGFSVAFGVGFLVSEFGEANVIERFNLRPQQPVVPLEPPQAGTTLPDRVPR